MILARNNEILIEAISQFVLSGLDRVLSRDRVVGELKLLLAIEPTRFASIMTDAWACVDTLSYCRSQDGGSRRDTFIQLTKELSTPYYLLFEEKFDTETMAETGMMTPAEVKTFNQKLIRLKTKT